MCYVRVYGQLPADIYEPFIGQCVAHKDVDSSPISFELHRLQILFFFSTLLYLPIRGGDCLEAPPVSVPMDADPTTWPSPAANWGGAPVECHRSAEGSRCGHLEWLP